MLEVRLKSVSPDVTEAAINYWHVEEGDYVEKGQDLVEISLNGASYNMLSPGTGTLAEVYFDAGQTIEIGEVIAEIEEE